MCLVQWTCLHFYFRTGPSTFPRIAVQFAQQIVKMWVLVRRFDRIILVAAFALEDAPCLQTFGRWLEQSMIHLPSLQIYTPLLQHGKSFHCIQGKCKLSLDFSPLPCFSDFTEASCLQGVERPFHRSPSRKGSPMEPPVLNWTRRVVGNLAFGGQETMPWLRIFSFAAK